MTELRGNWLTYAILYAEHIELWRHLAKTQLLYDAQIYLYNVNKHAVAVFSLGGATAR